MFNYLIIDHGKPIIDLELEDMDMVNVIINHIEENKGFDIIKRRANLLRFIRDRGIKYTLKSMIDYF